MLALLTTACWSTVLEGSPSRAVKLFCRLPRLSASVLLPDGSALVEPCTAVTALRAFTVTPSAATVAFWVYRLFCSVAFTARVVSWMTTPLPLPPASREATLATSVT